MPCIAADTKTTPSSKMESHFHHGVPAVAETSIGDVITANNATTYAEFDPVTDYCLFEEEESLADDESATAVLESFNDFLISLYIPLLIKSVFGGVYVIRSVILGYAMQYAMRCLSFSEQTAGRWLGTGVKGGAWPPPTLIGLGVLTVVALVVHPDGYTWILLRKLR